MTYVKFNQPALKTLDSFLDNLFNEMPSTRSNGNNFPPVNISETKDQYELEFNVPGRNKEDFKINVEENTLTISFEKKQDNENKTHKTVRREFTFESFKRSFNLGEEINADQIQAKYDNGVLKLYLPKKPVVKESAKQITIQ